jgi:hypothetical protein
MTAWFIRMVFLTKTPKGTQVKADLEKQKAFIENYHNLLKETLYDELIEFSDGVATLYGLAKSAVDGSEKTKIKTL